MLESISFSPEVVRSFINSIMGFVPQVIRATVTAVLGFGLLYLLTRGVQKVASKRFSASVVLLVRKVLFYVGAFLLTTTILMQLGINLSALLGAAGILSVAIGFATQTSLSNIVSGILLIAEKSFQMGDTIQMGGINGVVESIDFLSTKVRTAENHAIRIPNEQIIRSPLTNLTQSPTIALKLHVWVNSDAVSFDAAIKTVREATEPLQQDGCKPEPFYRERINGTIIIEHSVTVPFAQRQTAQTAIICALQAALDKPGQLRRIYFPSA